MDHKPRLNVLPANQQVAEQLGRFARVRRSSGRRHLLFLPFAVLKVGTTADERLLLSKDRHASAAAARHSFWRELPAKSIPLGFAGLAQRRYQQVKLADFPAVAGILDDRLQAARHYPRRSMAGDVMRLPLIRDLHPTERDDLANALDGHELPATSMHSDMHFFNFVRSSGQYRIIDWDGYDASGSFALDYVKFHVEVDRLNGGLKWPGTLSATTHRHPAVRNASRVLEVDPRALVTHFAAVITNNLVARHQRFRWFGPNRRSELINCLRQVIASFVRVIAMGPVVA